MRSPSLVGLLSRRGAHRRGSALLEFALVSLILFLLLAGTIELGRALFVAQGLQDAARVAAREIALTPLPAAIDPADGLPVDLQEDGVALVFSSQWLVVQLDPPLGAPIDPATFMDDKPLLNRALRPFMIVERVEWQGQALTLLRYPGALLEDPAAAALAPDSNPGLTVGIPVVDYDPVSGREQGLSWVPIVEEVLGAQSEFPLRGDGGGLVQLRVNYPFQAAALTLHGPGADPNDPFDPNLGRPVQADDAALSADPTPAGTTLTSGLVSDGAYGGVYGLGRLQALGQEVRPFRRVLSGQAIFRREVFR